MYNNLFIHRIIYNFIYKVINNLNVKKVYIKEAARINISITTRISGNWCLGFIIRALKGL